MKKIMFNDKYGLTDAVLQGQKTMTRRLVNEKNIIQVKKSDGIVHHVDNSIGSYYEYIDKDGKKWLAWSPYKIGDIVAVAQKYEILANSGTQQLALMMETSSTFKKEYCGAGWSNKMFVKAEFMPLRIKITNIKLERLQEISEEDCMKEGIYIDKKSPRCYYPFYTFKNSFIQKTPLGWDNARDAFAALIDKVSGKDTWYSNPWVFAYEFELIK